MTVVEKNKRNSNAAEKAKLKILIVEDDFASGRIMEEYLSEYGDCAVAVNGVEGIEAFENAFTAGMPYDLVCLDITMPEIDGHDVLKLIRQIEEDHGVFGLSGVIVFMTTAKDCSEDMIEAFDEGCESYIVKPFSQEQLVVEMQKFNLVSKNDADG